MWFVELPSQTQALVVAVVVAAFNLLIQRISIYLPWLAAFLRQYAQEWSTAIAVAVVVWLETNLPGAEYADLSIQAVTLVFSILFFLLGKLTLGRAGVRGFV